MSKPADGTSTIFSGEWLKHGYEQSFPQVGLAYEDKERRVCGIHIEVADDL